MTQTSLPVHTIRRALVVFSLLGLLGLGAELLSIGHYYAKGQVIPYVMILLALLAGLFYLARDTRQSRLVLRVVAAIVVLGGLYGALEHSQQNNELRAAGRQNELGTSPEAKPGEPGLLGLPYPGNNLLNGPASMSATFAMSGLGLLLLLAMYRREHDADVADTAAPVYARSGD